MTQNNFTLATAALEARDDLGEGPLWDARSETLYWVVRCAKWVRIA